MDSLKDPEQGIELDVRTDKPCISCFFFQWSRCLMRGVTISGPKGSTCSLWVNGLQCSEHPEEQDFRIVSSCPWCGYKNEVTAKDCQFEKKRKAMDMLLGRHMMLEHADILAVSMSMLSSVFPQFAAMAVDAVRRLGKMGDWCRRSGRVVGELNEAAKKINK